MIILGVLLLVGGIGSTIAGVSMNNSVEAQLQSFWEHGSMNPRTAWIVIGLIVAALGVILIIAGIAANNKDSSNTPPDGEN